MNINSPNTLIIWFRNDLRIEDNELLYRAQQKASQLVPVYCFDPRDFASTSLGFPKTDAFRTQFLLESLENLRQKLRALGSDLVIRLGKPEDIIPELAQATGANMVYSHQEVGTEEQNIEEVLEARLWNQQIAYERFWDSTLYHLEDLPYPLASLPDIFTKFRKKMEKQVKVRASVPAVNELPPLPDNIELGDLASWADLGLNPPERDPRAALDFKGGEEMAWQRLEEYFWRQDLLKTYKESRNGLLGADYSSKFSPWLALGCISPRSIYWQVKKYEKERRKNSSTYWLIFELIWRDYFRFVCKKYGARLFFKKGIKNQLPFRLYDNHKLFQAWCEGQTGIPFIDANMRELAQSGFMSNRGRQNVASFLVKDLKVNWIWGAMYFESKLIDYDVASNWGNWAYVAGVGNDPRENRYFNIMSQAKRYDGKGEYVKHWLPELAKLPKQIIHHPKLNPSEQKDLGLDLGSDYPQPLVKFETWL